MFASGFQIKEAVPSGVLSLSKGWFMHFLTAFRYKRNAYVIMTRN